MNSELLSEIYKKTKQENALESNIEMLVDKKYSNGISKEQYRVTKKIDIQDKGLYTILNADTIPYDIENQINIIDKFSTELKSYFKECNMENILIVGLGNRHISADSLGAKVAKNIIVTRHIPEIKNLRKVSVIVPSVLGLTGIESYDIISSVVDKIRPTLVIAIDSLCASSYTRLGTSFQINNASIIPGGGVQNARKKLDAKSLNADFVSIGVPLVIYANTFCDYPSKSLNHLIVTLKDIEETSHICAKIIAYSLNIAIHDISLKDVKDYLNNI